MSHTSRDAVHVHHCPDRRISCRSGAEGEGAELLYCPLAVGNKWVYDQDGREVSEEVSAVVADDGQTRVTSTFTVGPGNSWETEYVLKDGVVYQSRTAGFVFDPPVREVDLDLKSGAK